MRAHHSMGNWKSRLIKKHGKASRTKSTPARLYVARPPATGWPGGNPADNGYRRGSSR